MAYGDDRRDDKSPQEDKHDGAKKEEDCGH
jgi:hypothetical protein